MLATPQSRLRRASFSLRLGHGAALICHRHIIHYRAATSLPYTGETNWGRGERVREICLPRSGYSTQRLPSAEERQAGGRTGTPSPASGEGKGADVPTAPYKHRLAHASGRHSRSERAFWCVRVSGCPQACFAFGDPDGSHDPLGKGGAAERWRVVYSVGIATRHGAQPVTTRTSKRKSPPDRRTN